MGFVVVMGVEVAIANLEDEKSRVWVARVARIKARIDEKTRTLPLTIEIAPIVIGQLENQGAGNRSMTILKPGSFVRCRILGETLRDVFRLPRHLLRSENRLFIVKDATLHIQKVDVLRKFEGHVFIRSGLEAGDGIVSSPLPGAREGMAVSLKQGDR